MNRESSPRLARLRGTSVFFGRRRRDRPGRETRPEASGDCSKIHREPSATKRAGPMRKTRSPRSMKTASPASMKLRAGPGSVTRLALECGKRAEQDGCRQQVEAGPPREDADGPTSKGMPQGGPGRGPGPPGSPGRNGSGCGEDGAPHTFDRKTMSMLLFEGITTATRSGVCGEYSGSGLLSLFRSQQYPRKSLRLLRGRDARNRFSGG